MTPAERLEEIFAKLSSDQSVEPLTVRQFISWFGAERRGYMVAWRISRALERAKLITVPDFNGVHIDSRIRFALKLPPVVEAATGQTIQADQPLEEATLDAQLTESSPLIVGASADPAFRVGRLGSANIKPLSVAPDCSLAEAVTLMLRHDYSQLPVMTNERDVKGIVSWESVGSRLALRKQPISAVRECMKEHFEVLSTDSLFRVIGHIIEHSYVLVRGDDKTITGIVTTADLSAQFQQLSEPFLLLSEIENHVRLVIDGKFTAEELASAKDTADPERVIESVADLTLGEYIRLLENPANWGKTGLTVDRKVFIRELDNVRRIRNDVMHFDPDGITPEDHQLLRHFLQFMHELREIAGKL